MMKKFSLILICILLFSCTEAYASLPGDPEIKAYSEIIVPTGEKYTLSEILNTDKNKIFEAYYFIPNENLIRINTNKLIELTDKIIAEDIVDKLNYEYPGVGIVVKNKDGSTSSLYFTLDGMLDDTAMASTHDKKYMITPEEAIALCSFMPDRVKENFGIPVNDIPYKTIVFILITIGAAVGLGLILIKRR